MATRKSSSSGRIEREVRERCGGWKHDAACACGGSGWGTFYIYEGEERADVKDPYPHVCPDCLGSGYAPVHYTVPYNNDYYPRGNDREPPCPTCGGYGQLFEVAAFQGRTTEEAKANAKAAMAAPPPKKIVKLTISRQPQQAAAEGEGPTLEAATQQAENRVAKDAIDIGQAEVVQAGGEHGVLEINAMDEVAARTEWNSRKSPSSALTQFECLVAPRQGFLGIGKRSGVWKAHWAVPFRVRIAYKRPAEVTVSYTE